MHLIESENDEHLTPAVKTPPDDKQFITHHSL